MPAGSNRYFGVTVASGATLSSEADLQGAWSKVFLEIRSMTSNSQLHIQGASESGGTYRRVMTYDPASAAVSVTFTIASSVSSHMVPIPAHGLRFLKVEQTATADSGQAFRIICGN